MAIKSAIPYLTLNGRAKQALEQYQVVLKGEVTTVQRFGDVDQSCPAASRELIMHAELKLGSVVLMLSDGHGEGPVPPEGAVKVALAFDDAKELRRVFDALSDGGEVIQAPMDAPWGDVFCAFADRYGVCWMMTSPQNG